MAAGGGLPLGFLDQISDEFRETDTVNSQGRDSETAGEGIGKSTREIDEEEGESRQTIKSDRPASPLAPNVVIGKDTPGCEDAEEKEGTEHSQCSRDYSTPGAPFPWVGAVK